MSNKASLITKIIWAHVVMVMVGVGIMASCAKRDVREASKDLPSYQNVPEFSLTNQDGQAFGLKDLKGKVWVAGFVFTRCGNPCPVITRNMRLIEDKITGFEDGRLVTITVDPEFDRPEILKRYAESYEAGDEWSFLTGEKPDIYTLIQQGFLQPVEEPAGMEAQFIHTTKLVLVDGEGMIRGFYEGVEKEQINRLLSDFSKLIRKDQSTL